MTPDLTAQLTRTQLKLSTVLDAAKALHTALRIEHHAYYMESREVCALGDAIFFAERE